MSFPSAINSTSFAQTSTAFSPMSGQDPSAVTRIANESLLSIAATTNGESSESERSLKRVTAVLNDGMQTPDCSLEQSKMKVTTLRKEIFSTLLEIREKESMRVALQKKIDQLSRQIEASKIKVTQFTNEVEREPFFKHERDVASKPTTASTISYSSLPDVLILLIPELLGFGKSVSQLPTLNRRHRDLFTKSGYFFSRIQAAPLVVKRLFAHLRQFSKLKSLSILSVRTEQWEVIDFKDEINHITTLCIAETKWISPGFVVSLLLRLPQLTEFSLASESSTDQNIYFSSNMSEDDKYLLKSNLINLTKLDLKYAKVPSERLLWLLKGSKKIVFLNLCSHGTTNDLLKHIVKNRKLKHLDLSMQGGNLGEVDFQILASLQKLQTFVAGREIPVAPFIGILSANRGITALNLSRSPQLQTPEVLSKISELLPNVQITR